MFIDGIYDTQRGAFSGEFLANLCCFLFGGAHPTENKSFALSDLRPEFHAKLDGLREYMGGILENPRRFGDRSITGGLTLQPLMKALCAAVSESNAVKPLR